jgi:hypothetical protein
MANPELLTAIAIRAFARATDAAIRENDRLGVPSYGGKDGKIVVRHPPLTATDLSHDAWNVMRGLLPADADVALLLAAREAAFDVHARIMDAARRDGLNAATAHLLDCAHMSVVGRIAMLDNWRGQLSGTAFIPRPYGEDTDYARAMRLRPEKLREVIAVVDEPPRMDKTIRKMYRCTWNGCALITERPARERWTHLSQWGHGIRDGYYCPAHTAAIIDDPDNEP